MFLCGLKTHVFSYEAVPGSGFRVDIDRPEGPCREGGFGDSMSARRESRHRFAPVAQLDRASAF